MINQPALGQVHEPHAETTWNVITREAPHALRRVAPPFFWVLLALEAAVLLAALNWALTVAPAPQALSVSADRAMVREAVLARIHGDVTDPLVEVTPLTLVRESQLRGFHLNGTVYFYYVEGQPGYDPLSRGAVHHDQVEVLLRDQSGPHDIVIYRLR